MSLATSDSIAFIPTNNTEAARVFYEQTLGLTFVSADPFSLIFRVGPSRTMLRVVRTGPFTPQTFTIFGWEVPDVQAAVAELAAKGIEFLRFPSLEQDMHGVWTSPGGAHIAWFKDPDGNALSVSDHPA